ncbi:hypothetical protein AVEN_172588-1 [Araneus ventricosus]|nr:hypothetical protein AVEN_172588-1 [Araneus ventricosus]
MVHSDAKCEGLMPKTKIEMLVYTNYYKFKRKELLRAKPIRNFHAESHPRTELRQHPETNLIRGLTNRSAIIATSFRQKVGVMPISGLKEIEYKHYEIKAVRMEKNSSTCQFLEGRN